MRVRCVVKCANRSFDLSPFALSKCACNKPARAHLARVHFQMPNQTRSCQGKNMAGTGCTLKQKCTFGRQRRKFMTHPTPVLQTSRLQHERIERGKKWIIRELEQAASMQTAAASSYLYLLDSHLWGCAPKVCWWKQTETAVPVSS